ncbi:hypothetical protein B0H14DRAFT_3565984 [Mycena olivaceomarginata]|nr:hypothetical protein B0H14DRAFT_3565984 [Mycena olivaceomarginata]
MKSVECKSSLITLYPSKKTAKLRITGTALNAVGALIQQVNEEAGNSDFAIFSTLLSPLISKQLPQNKMYGTIIGHIQAACQGAPMDILLAKSRWLFPMYGSAPPHWVLGWMSPALGSFIYSTPFSAARDGGANNIEMTRGMNQFIDDARMDIDLPEPWNIKSERIAIVEPANATIPDTSSSKRKQERKIEETADNGSVESARQTSIATRCDIRV